MMTPLTLLKRLANTPLSRFGQQVARSSVVPSFDRFADALRAAELDPATVFDVGVAEGTPWLYHAFPYAQYHLIDPTRESLAHMRGWATKLNAQIHSFALGQEVSTAQITVRPELAASSFYPEIGACEVRATYDVPVQRFDHVFRDFDRPAVCKIDVQGGELSVLSGMGHELQNVDALIVEVSLIATLGANAPELAEVLGHMRQQGFVLYDIVGMNRRPLDNALAQIDAVFVPETSPLRADRRWAADSYCG